MDFDSIRLQAIAALFGDDVLLDRLVLKGGNAIKLVYEVGQRSSLDLDFSIAGDFEDVTEADSRNNRRLVGHFAELGFTVFDYEFLQKPSPESGRVEPFWGGYEVRFKLMKTDLFIVSPSLEAAQRSSMVIGPAQKRTFTIDISKYEYCDGKQTRDLDFLRIYVYSPAMIVAEKLRAICQQMPSYTLRRNQKPRARDFYDIWVILNSFVVNVTEREFRELLSRMFETKKVPLSSLQLLNKQREFHRQDWPSVRDAAGSALGLEDFDYYFDFVLQQVVKLDTIWIE
jgi:predicted nucleotidyltransferase component of viral defense system